jgi:hypothetical protein
MAIRSTEAGPAEVRDSTDLRHLTFSQERALGRSVGLITVAMSTISLPAGARVLEVAPAEVAFMAVVADDITDRIYRR